MLNISNDRLKHSLEVARFMKKLSEEKGWSKDKCEEMFVLGFLHDIGYEFSNIQNELSFIGAEILKKQNYKYWREVYFHGNVDAEYNSEELKILNTADLNIDSTGRKVGVKLRLKDIGDRYGKTSKQYLDAKNLAQKIGLLT